jgi:type III secretion system YscD/HrpQ family protein
MDNADLQSTPEENKESQFNFQHYAEFRFIGGQSSGATLKLASGEYLIGNQDDCDIVFAPEISDPTVFKIIVSDEFIPSVSSVAGDFTLYGGNGETKALLGETPVELQSGMRIGCGTDFLVWHSNWTEYRNDWMLVSKSEIEALTKENRASVAPAETSGEQASGENSQDVQSDAQSAEGADAQTEEKSEKGVQTGESEKGKSNKRLLCTAAGLLILVMLYVSQNWGNISEFLFNGSEDEKTALENYVKSSPKGKLFFKDKGNIYNITGVFKNIEDYQTFVDGLPQSGKPIELNIKLLSEVIDTIKRTFRMYGLMVTPVVSDEHFDVYGYVIDPFAEADIRQKVKKDLMSYDFLNFHFVYRAQVEPYIADLLKEKSLDLELYFGRGFIAYKGLFSLSELEKLKEVRRVTSDFVGGDVDIRSYDSLSSEEKKEIIDSTKDSGPKKTGIELPAVISEIMSAPKEPLRTDKKDTGKTDFSIKNITGITKGLQNFMTTKDGNTYFPGARLPGGYEIIKIEPEYIEVEKNGEREVIYIK